MKSAPLCCPTRHLIIFNFTFLYSLIDLFLPVQPLTKVNTKEVGVLHALQHTPIQPQIALFCPLSVTNITFVFSDDNFKPHLNPRLSTLPIPSWILFAIYW